MALLLPVNAVVDIYRGLQVAQPYPTQGGPAPAVSQVGGHLKHQMRHGRFGTALELHWTHALYLPLSTDIRDAYNDQWTTWSPANADTVILADHPIPGWCTAFAVVLVQKHKRGTPQEVIVAYLDRLRPAQGPCVQPASGITVNCCPINPIPTTIHATLGTCSPSCYSPVTIPLVYSALDNWWTGAATFANACLGISQTVSLTLLCRFDSTLNQSVFKLIYQCGQPGGGIAITTWLWQPPPISTCSPLSLVFSIQGSVAGCCQSGDTSTYSIIVTL